MLADIPLKFKSFPTIKEIYSLLPKEFDQQKTVEYPPWESSQAPGTPASVEALFNLIHEGRTETTGFRYGLKYTRISEDKLFEYYEAWLKGEVHEDLKNFSPKPFII